ncbi:hypothetical protein ACFQ8C_01840 [Streptomyces sp. NPDC056503]|uniref:hypothetical protein n=1 Tax=Streptomyces sp. NPDC056503 TaxID=3345842 RepID=UPI00369B5544
MKYAKTVAALALVLLASGCSQAKEEKRAFEVPDSLCGTPVPAELLSPLLPASGDKLEVKRRHPDMKGALSCDIVVDGTTDLGVDWEWRKIGPDPGRIARENPYVKRDTYESEDGRYVYADRGGVIRVTCEPVVEHRKGTSELFASVLVSNEGRSDSEAVKNLLEGYAKALSASPECEQK